MGTSGLPRDPQNTFPDTQPLTRTDEQHVNPESNQHPRTREKRLHEATHTKPKHTSTSKLAIAHDLSHRPRTPAPTREQPRITLHVRNEIGPALGEPSIANSTILHPELPLPAPLPLRAVGGYTRSLANAFVRSRLLPTFVPYS